MEALFPPRRLRKEQERFVRRCVDVIYALLRVYGFDDEGCKRKSTYDHWVYGAACCGDPVKYVKWRCAAYYSYHKGQELPPAPSVAFERPGVIAGAVAYRFLSVMKNDDSALFESFITSVLYSKKGMPRPDKVFVQEAERKAFAKLTKPVPTKPVFMKDWADTVEKVRGPNIESLLTVKSLCDQIRRTVHEIFEGSEYTEEDRVKPFFPSTSANYINTRSLGGAVGSILDDPELLRGLKLSDDLIRTEVIRTRRSVLMSCDVSSLKQRFRTLYKRIVDKAATELAVATPLGLPEALKARVISKGPPYLYTALKPLQRKMWSVLSKHPAFMLTGRPVDAWYVQKRMGKKLFEDESFLSVDYADATNEMMSFASECCASSLSKLWGLDASESAMFIRSLTGHQLEYDGVVAQQTMGQLMGSITSFPVLCIVNGAICRWAKELSTDRIWSLVDCPLAINGDDAILRCNATCRALWARIGAYCGLSPSVGKVYFSKDFLNINSTTYRYNPAGYRDFALDMVPGELQRFKTLYFDLIPYVNLGLLYSLKRSGGTYTSVDDTDDVTVGSRARALITGCPESLRERVLGQFIHLNKSQLSLARVPWFIPESLGGLGLPIVGKFTPVDKDLRLARLIHDHPADFRFPSRPTNAPWRVWDYAKKRVTFPSYAALNVDAFGTGVMKETPDQFGPFAHTIEMMTELQVLGMFCVEALFRSDGISSLYQINENNIVEAKKFQRARQNVWKAALRSGIPLPEPYNPERFPKSFHTRAVPYIFGVTQHVGLVVN
jgi:hypothetical protein